MNVFYYCDFMLDYIWDYMRNNNPNHNSNLLVFSLFIAVGFTLGFTWYPNSEPDKSGDGPQSTLYSLRTAEKIVACVSFTCSPRECVNGRGAGQDVLL